MLFCLWIAFSKVPVTEHIRNLITYSPRPPYSELPTRVSPVPGNLAEPGWWPLFFLNSYEHYVGNTS